MEDLFKDRFIQAGLLLLDGAATDFGSGVLTEVRFAQAGLLLLAGPSRLAFGASGVLGGTERFATDRLAHAGLPLLLVSEPVAERAPAALGSTDRFNDLVAQAGLESTDRGS
jgi:hypothetical protein